MSDAPETSRPTSGTSGSWPRPSGSRRSARRRRRPRRTRSTSPRSAPGSTRWATTTSGSASGEAPPSMAQVWTMPGLGRKRASDDPLHSMMELLTARGLHRRARHQHRADLRALPQGRRAAAGDHGARLRRRPEEHRDGRRLLRDLAQPLVRRATSWWPPCCSGCSSSSRGTPHDPADGQPRQRVLLGRHPEGRAADPELQRVRRAPAPARPGLPVVRGPRPRLRRRVRRRHRLLLRRAPAPAGPRQGAADRDRADRPRRGRADGGRGGRRR